MLRNITENLAQVLRDTVGQSLADDGIDAEIEPRMVVSASEGIVIDVFPGAPARDSEAAAFGDLSGFYVLTVRVRCSISAADEAQDILLDMIDDEHELSVAYAIESDQTLDGYSTQIVIDPDSFSGLLEYGQPVTMIGCTWRVLVGAAVS